MINLLYATGRHFFSTKIIRGLICGEFEAYDGFHGTRLYMTLLFHYVYKVSFFFLIT